MPLKFKLGDPIAWTRTGELGIVIGFHDTIEMDGAVLVHVWWASDSCITHEHPFELRKI